MFQLERIEWTNTWFEDTAPADKARVFLVGDSICNGYRSIVHRKIAGKYAVTAFATSKAVDNPWFGEELALTVKQAGFRYEHVHFNNGLHGWHLSDQEYKKYYQDLIRTVLRVFPDSHLSLALTTSVCVKNETPARLCEERNAVVLRRNEIVRELADMFRLPLDDLYTVSVEHMNEHVADGVHYTPQGYEVLGGAVADFLRAL